MRPGKQVRKYIEFGGRQAQNVCLSYCFPAFVYFVCLRGRSITLLGLVVSD